MKNADMPARPIPDTYHPHAGRTAGALGMTKREEFAARIMAGFAADHEMEGTLEAISDCAVRWADALLTSLEKPR